MNALTSVKVSIPTGKGDLYYGAKQNVNVAPHPDGGWQVKVDNARRAIVRTNTQREAIDRGRPLAKSKGVELVIHKPDGRIREKDSHGYDPYPPKG